MTNTVSDALTHYKPLYSDFTLESLTQAITLILEQNKTIDSITLDYYMRPTELGGLGYGHPKVNSIEEVIKTIQYKALYKGKELSFSIESTQFDPQPQTKLLKYDNIPLTDIPEGLVKELLSAIDEIEDWGEAKQL